MEIEADQKHVPQLLEHLGLIQSNIVKTLRVKFSVAETEAIENSPILEGEQATTFSERRRGRNILSAGFDVSRAHFYGVCERDVDVELRVQT